MYRQNYTDQPMSSNMPTGMNPSLQGYDYRNPNLIYKPAGSMDMVPSLHQNHPMYYDNQTMPQMEQNPYMNMMSVPNMEPSYEAPRYYWREMQPKHAEPYSSLPPPPPPQPQYTPPQLNLVQRISSLIKSQLPMLQAIMMQVSSNYSVSHSNPTSTRVQPRRHQSRSRSRSKQRHRKNSDSTHDWLCRKCSFSNYDWRENCKKCNQTRPSKNFVPGPEDWKCPKCSNINYARRMECNRCKRPKSIND